MKQFSFPLRFFATSRRATILRVGLFLAISSLTVAAFGQANSNANDRSSFTSRLGSTLKGANRNKAANQTRQDSASQTQARENQASAQRRANASGAVPSAANQQSPTPTAVALPEKKSCLLQTSHLEGATDVVEASLEASGEVIQTNASGEEERLPMEVVAGFKYEERFENFEQFGSARSFRQYEQAGMRRKLGADVSRRLLDSSRKHIVSEYDGKTTRVYSLAGPMKDDQYALLHELPFNTTILDKLLPGKVTQLQEDWQISDADVAALLCVDAIENNTLHLTLTSITDEFAEITLYLQGKKDKDGEDAPSTLICAAEGASVALDLEGKFQFDLVSKRISWFGVNIKERRSESIAAPGLDWAATLKINVAALEKPEKLTDDAIEPMKPSPKPEQLKLYYNAQKGGWKFQHSRSWKMIEDGAKVAALCNVVGGEAVAQCNILSNGKIDLATQPTLEGYKKEIKNGLGSRFGEFKQEAAYEGSNETSVYYVTVDGAYESIPFRWVYYLITDKQGNQATIMFEIRADLLDQYDDSGNEIVETFKIAPKNDLGLKASLEKNNDAKATKDDGRQEKPIDAQVNSNKARKK